MPQSVPTITIWGERPIWVSTAWMRGLIMWALPKVFTATVFLSALTATIMTSYVPLKPRSEERRVGKECRSRWAPDQFKKKEGRRKEQARAKTRGENDCTAFKRRIVARTKSDKSA